MGGALAYTVGVYQYWTAALVTIMNDCPATTLAPLVYYWLIDLWYIIAGAAPDLAVAITPATLLMDHCYVACLLCASLTLLCLHVIQEDTTHKQTWG